MFGALGGGTEEEVAGIDTQEMEIQVGRLFDCYRASQLPVDPRGVAVASRERVSLAPRMGYLYNECVSSYLDLTFRVARW